MAKVDVVVRFRPKFRGELLQEEKDPQHEQKQEWINIDERSNRVSVSKLSFFFHDVIGEETNQAACFDSSFRRYCHRFLSGRNVTFVAYGPSASGKTYTMFGIGNEHRHAGSALHFGLVPRFVSYLLEQLSESREVAQFQVKTSFVECYKERLFDLLKKSRRAGGSEFSGASTYTDDDTMSMTSTTSTGTMATGLHLRMATANLDLVNDRIQFDNLTSARVSSIEDVLRLVNIALRKRRWATVYDEYGEVNMENLSPGSRRRNLTQSKSHTVMMMTVKRQMRDGRRMVSHVTFVDLADAPRIRKGASSQEKLDHRVLNQSLLAIGQVTSALHQNKKEVPWKDSSLTKCMYNGLKENGDMCLILSCSPSFIRRESTLKSFRFGNLALTDPMLLNILDQLRREVKILKEKKPERTGTASDMAEEILHLREEIASYHKEMRRRDKTIEELTGKIAKRDIAKAQQDKRLYEKILSERDLRDRLNMLQDDLNQAEEQLETYEREDNEKKERTAKLQEQIEELKQQQEVTSVVEVDSAEIQRMQQLVSTLETQLTDVRSELESARMKISDYESTIQTKNERISFLESADQTQRMQMRQVQNELDHMKQNTITKEDNDQQLSHLMSELEARSREIIELHQDVDELNAVREENEMLRIQRRELETQLHKFIESQQKQMTLNAEFRRASVSPDGAVPAVSSGPLTKMDSSSALLRNSQPPAIIPESPATSNSEALASANRTIESLEEQISKLNSDLANSNDRIRKLEDDKNRLQNVTGVGTENIVQKYRDKIAALQERLIMVRTEKATLIPKVNQEKMHLEERIATLKRDSRVNTIVFKWRSLISQNRVKNLSKDLNHLRERMEKAYSDQTHARRQLSEFRGMAEKRLQEVLHMPDEDEPTPNFSRLSTFTSDGVPSDLGKISSYVDDLAKKLDEKNTEIERLHDHIAQVERDLRQAKREGGQAIPSSPRNTGSPNSSSFGGGYFDANTLPNQLEDDFKEEDDYDDPVDPDFDLTDQIDYLRTTNFVSKKNPSSLKISRKKETTPHARRSSYASDDSSSTATTPVTRRKMVAALARVFNNISIGLQLDSSYSRVAVDEKTTIADLIAISTGGVILEEDEAKNVEEVPLKFHVVPNPEGEPFTIDTEDHGRSVIDMLLDYNIFGFAKFYLTTSTLAAARRAASNLPRGNTKSKIQIGRMFSRTTSEIVADHRK